MKKAIILSYSKEAEIFKALSHPTRLFIVHKLKEKDICVCELTAMIGDDISTVSKHLSVLKTAGIADSTRKKNQIIYRLKMRCVIDMSLCINRKRKAAL